MKTISARAKVPAMPLDALSRDISLDLQSAIRHFGRPLRYRARAVANDALVALGREPRFPERIGDQWRRVLARSVATWKALPPAGAPRVLFGTVWGANTAAAIIEGTLMMALRMRGATPVALSCDKVLPACEWNPFGNFDPPPPSSFGQRVTPTTKLDRCRDCVSSLRSSHSLPGVVETAFSRVAHPGDRERAERVVDEIPYERYRDFVYRELHVGEHAYASLLRATLRGTLLDTPETRWLFRRYMVAAVLVTDLGERVFDDVRPDRFVAVHGFYVSQGTLCELARRRRVPVTVYGTPYRKNTIWLSHDDTYYRTLLSDKVAGWDAFEMTPERRRIADEYLASKHVAARDYTSYHVNAIQDHDAIRRELDLDERPIVSLYTNVIWDAQLYYSLSAFPDMIEWMFETIRYFESRPDKQLVIRLHPGEARGASASNQPLSAEIERTFPRLPANVRVVAPESKVSSYSLGAMSQAALIYGARMGVELAILGTPVIIAGDTFIRGKGFSHDVATREEYFSLLDRLDQLPRNPEEIVDRARKWYYYYFFRLMLPYDYYRVDDGVHMSNPRLRLKHLDELAEGRSKVLDLVCQGIIDGKTPFEWDQFD